MLRSLLSLAASPVIAAPLTAQAMLSPPVGAIISAPDPVPPRGSEAILRILTLAVELVAAPCR